MAASGLPTAGLINGSLQIFRLDNIDTIGELQKQSALDVATLTDVTDNAARPSNDCDTVTGTAEHVLTNVQ